MTTQHYGMILGVLGFLVVALQSFGVKPTPPAPARSRRPRRIRRTRRQPPRQRPAAPPVESIDRGPLVACLRQLGHRAAEARRLAATVPADVTGIDEAIEFIYRRA